MSFKELRYCRRCGKPFVANHNQSVYCGYECRKRKKDKKPDIECPCGKRFIRKTANQKYCSSDCRKQFWDGVSPKSKKPKSQKPLKPGPRGRYVYVWFKDNEVLPFYIGKGVGGRAWERHKIGCGETARPAYCQRLREQASAFSIKIIKDNLTAEGARLVESALIGFLDLCGVMLSNQCEPERRTEKGLLTLGDANPLELH
ncbi:MAG: hypothetical protein WC919_06120 [Candidatus Paceibacterota bacterium]